MICLPAPAKHTCRSRALLILAALAAPGCADRNPQNSPGQSTDRSAQPFPVIEVLRGDPAQSFAQADQPRQFQFPADHGPHNEYRTEWWYFTGNVDNGKDRRFGYQLTFFRFRPTLKPRGGRSHWRAEQLYMAHLALTDIDSQQFHAVERFSRGAAGLAGARVGTLHVWLDDWSAAATSARTFPLRLRAGADGISLDLSLEQGKGVVLHGDNGLSVKHAEPGNASYYYSYTRMPTEGHISISDQTYTVRGNSWMDREWSSSALGKDQLGWDWFALQLASDYELMYYRFRRTDATRDRFSYGAVVFPDGRVDTLDFDEVELDILDTWQSPGSAVVYPAAWRLRVPKHELDLNIRPALAAQELDLSFRYWEGAVELSGAFGAAAIDGRGYVELAGYGATAAPRAR